MQKILNNFSIVIKIDIIIFYAIFCDSWMYIDRYVNTLIIDNINETIIKTNIKFPTIFQGFLIIK